MGDFKIRLTPHNLSSLIWQQWVEQCEVEIDPAIAELRRQSEACEGTRQHMSYNTGSIPFASALLLYLAIRGTRPRCIFEVGTFVGKSTLAMALAADHNGQGTEIFTCDGSNDFFLPKMSKTPVHGYPKTISTAALQDMAAKGRRVDFFHIDGRLALEDFDILEAIADPRAVLALDDFEGIEKGVANYSTFRGRKFFQQHVLVYPPSDSDLQKMGLRSRSTTALFVPFSSLTYTAQ